MTATEIIQKLKQTFNELQNSNPTAQPSGATTPQKKEEPQKTKMAKLADGTEVEISELIVGGIVTQNGTPMPSGEYTLEDGTTIVVGDNGAITQIAPPQTSENAKPSTDPTLDMAKKLMMSTEEFQKFQTLANDKFASYETKFADFEAKLDKATRFIGELLNLTQTLAETPTGQPDPSIKGANNFGAESKKEANFDILFS